jgi:hypothetical protein
MSISEPFRYRNDSFQSDIFSSDIGITDVDVGSRISPILRSMSMPTYAYKYILLSEFMETTAFTAIFMSIRTGNHLFMVPFMCTLGGQGVFFTPDSLTLCERSKLSLQLVQLPLSYWPPEESNMTPSHMSTFFFIATRFRVNAGTDNLANNRWFSQRCSVIYIKWQICIIIGPLVTSN